MTQPTYLIQIDWNNDGDYSDFGEDVTDRVLSRTPLVIQRGRDQARTLTPITPSRTQLEIDNRSRDYSPENTGSPLSGKVRPGRPLRIQAVHNSITYGLYDGYLDDFDILPDLEERSIALSTVDQLGRLRGKKVTTDLYRGIRTGDAVGRVLDAAGWPAEMRHLDPGATTIPWWWADNEDAFDAIQRIIKAEGLPGMIAVYTDGMLHYRDRHHRLMHEASMTSQVTFRGDGAEPTMATRLVYDHGWRDIVNSVAVTVDERRPASELETVWQSSTTHSISSGETRQIVARSGDPFFGAVVPVAGTDYRLLSGAVSVTLSRTQGASTTINITATSAAVLTDLALRAYPLSVIGSTVVLVEDPASITEHDRRSLDDDIPWVGLHDALAVAEVIIGGYAERRPVVTMRVVGGHDTRIAQQLGRELCDRVTIIEDETGLNTDFYIETIQHRTDGTFHETTFGCEKVPTVPVNVFMFDTAGQGFNDGVFGQIGLDDPALIFIFDTAGHGFDDSRFAT